MLVTLLVKFRNKDWKTTELLLLLQVLPVHIVTFVETLGSHLKRYSIKDLTSLNALKEKVTPETVYFLKSPTK